MDERYLIVSATLAALTIPRCVSGFPEFIQVFPVALCVHGVPESPVLANIERAISCELCQRLLFQHAAVVGAEIMQKVAPKEEVAAVNPIIGKFRLFCKFDDFAMVELKLSEARRRIDAEHCSYLLLGEVKLEFVAKIGVGKTVPVRHGKVVCVAKILCGGSRDSRACHGERASICERHLPVLIVINLVNGHIVGFERDGKIAIHRRIIKEIGLDNLGLVAKTEDEGLETMVRVRSHDVPKNGVVPHWHHGFRANIGFLPQARAEPATEDKDGDLRGLQLPDLVALYSRLLLAQAVSWNL